MVLPNSHKVPRVPWYSGTRIRSRLAFRVRGSHPLWPAVPDRSTRRTICNSSTRWQPDHIGPHDTTHATPARLARAWFRLIRFRSPLLTESRLLSLPPGTEMVHFPPFAPTGLCIQPVVTEHDLCRVAPFGHPRITACLRLPEAFRSLLRPSSPLGAKASTVYP